jgi:hypothetical protein
MIKEIYGFYTPWNRPKAYPTSYLAHTYSNLHIVTGHLIQLFEH